MSLTPYPPAAIRKSNVESEKLLHELEMEYFGDPTSLMEETGRVRTEQRQGGREKKRKTYQVALLPQGNTATCYARLGGWQAMATTSLAEEVEKQSGEGQMAWQCRLQEPTTPSSLRGNLMTGGRKSKRKKADKNIKGS